MISSRVRTLHEDIGNDDLVFAVNNYQRFYVWDKEKVKTYLTDIDHVVERQAIEASPKHFFGQFIILEIAEDDHGTKTYEVIDGQQRLTTFLLLVACIYGAAQDVSNRFPVVQERMGQLKSSCNKYLFSIKEGQPRKAKFTLSERDNAYFNQILTALRMQSTPPSATQEYISHVHLWGAQQCITDWLSNKIQSLSDPDLLFDCLEKICNIAAKSFQIVLLKPTHEKYTYRLYQVVNDRGEPLKDSELLKAKSIEVLVSSPDYLAEAQQIWDDILKDSGKDTEDFLKWCYISKIGDSWKQDRMYRAFVETYFAIPDNSDLSELQKQHFIENLRGLHEDIKICRLICKGVWPFQNSSLQEWQRQVLSNLVIGMRHTLCIPLLISAVRQPAIHGVTSEKNFYNILELCENYFILVKGLFRLREDKIKKHYYSAARQIRDNPSQYRSHTLKEALNTIEPEMIRRDCMQKLRDLTYHAKADNPTMKYLCILLETYWRCFDTNGNVVTSRVPNGSSLIYSELSLEHIYPKSAKGNDIDPDMEPQKNKLGNMFIFGSADNSNLGDKPYSIKKPIYATSRFVTANDVAVHNESWSINEFQIRHEDVCQKLANLLLRFS